MHDYLEEKEKLGQLPGEYESSPGDMSPASGDESPISEEDKEKEKALVNKLVMKWKTK